MLLGSAVAGLLWLLLGAVPHTYVPMLVTAVMMNAGLVLLSSATAGLLVEDGQRLGATGRLTAARLAVMSGATVLGSLVGGFLAQRGLIRAAAGISALILFSTVPIVWKLLVERRVDVPANGVLRAGWGQLKLAVRRGTLWAGAGMLFLIHVSPGFVSPLYDHLTADLGFSKQFIGVMQSVAGGVQCKQVMRRSCAHDPHVPRRQSPDLADNGMISLLVERIGQPVRLDSILDQFEPMVGGVTRGMGRRSV
jgi:hypothetical protein